MKLNNAVAKTRVRVTPRVGVRVRARVGVRIWVRARGGGLRGEGDHEI